MSNSSNNPVIGKVLLHFEKLPSTNEYALNLLSKTKPEDGTVILTDNQYKGRGQYGNQWHSLPDKNLTLSVILYPTFLPANHVFLLNQACCLSIIDFICSIVSAIPKIKWPNDIYIGEKKISGILIQNGVFGQSLKNAVIGIGININQNKFPDGINATSLNMISQSEFRLDEIRVHLFRYLENRYNQLRTRSYDEIKREYIQHLYGHLEWRYFEVNNQRRVGKINGVHENGKLIIEWEDRKIESFDIKTIKYL